MSKSVALLLVCFFLSASFLIVAPAVKAEPKRIVVPDDYSTIQEAVDNAPEGSTVFVKSGKYEKIVRIRKPLSLIGENPENTILETPKIIFSEGVIQAYSENITISGFRIRNCDMGIWAFGGCKIVGNQIENAVGMGMAISGRHNIISGNNIKAKRDGIRIYSNDSIVSGNIITEHNVAISAGSCKNLTIYNNTLTTNSVGLKLSGPGPFYIYVNNITNNEVGLQLLGCNNASIYENNIKDNGIGVVFENYNYQFGPGPIAQGSGNFICKNNFVNNQRQVVLDKTWNVLQWDLTEYYPDAINGTDSASWHKDNVGNYWSDYFGVDDDGDGIGDSQYIVYENMNDNYPLMMPTETSATPSQSPEPTVEPTPEPELVSTTIIEAAFVASALLVIVGLLVYFKKRKR